MPRSDLSLVSRDQPIPAKVLDAGKLTAKNYSISESGTSDYIEGTEKKVPSSDQSEIVSPPQDDSSEQPSTDKTENPSKTTDENPPEN